MSAFLWVLVIGAAAPITFILGARWGWIVDSRRAEDLAAHERITQEDA